MGSEMCIRDSPAAAGVEVFDKNFGIESFSVLGPDGMGLELGDDLLGQQFHNDKILETVRNARTAKETKPPCANKDKSSSLGIFAQGGYLAGPGGGEVYPRKLFPIFVVCSNTQAGMNRIILFGYGFDLAHDLPTSYKDFINHYRSNGKIHAEQLDFPTTHSREICAFLKIAVNRICQYIHTGQHNDASDKDTRLPAGRALLFGRLFHIRQTIICVSCRSQSLFSAGESSLPFQGPPTGKSASPSESARNAPA